MEMTAKNRLREAVKQEYEEKLDQADGFCAHQFETDFGYSNEELENVPQDALESSFGCANPLSFGTLNLGDTVVDLGSGAGIDVILAAQKVGASGKVIGVDMTGSMIDKARQNIREAKLETIAEIREGVIESLPIESNSVDWVVSNCVVSLSPEKEKVFSEVDRVLKPGGKMLLTDLVMEPIPWWMRKLIAIKSPASAKALGLHQYLGVVRAAGLAEVSLRSKLEYDREMLETLARQELNLRISLFRAVLRLELSQISSNLLLPLVSPLSRLAHNKVASIKVYAEKPIG